MNFKHVFVFALLIACAVAYRSRDENGKRIRLYRRGNEQSFQKNTETNEASDDINPEPVPEDESDTKTYQKWRNGNCRNCRWRNRRYKNINEKPEHQNENENQPEEPEKIFYSRINRRRYYNQNKMSDDVVQGQVGNASESRPRHNYFLRSSKNNPQEESLRDEDLNEERKSYLRWHRMRNNNENEETIEDSENGENDLNRRKHHHRHRPNHHHRHHHHHCRTSTTTTTTSTSPVPPTEDLGIWKTGDIDK